mgnify:CR=1 FL=1
MNKLLQYFKGDELAASTWQNKYAIKGEETPNDTHRRLARELAKVENHYNIIAQTESKPEDKFKLSEYGYNRENLTEDSIFELFKDFKYIIPGGSVMAGCGAEGLTSLSNCFVIGSPKDSYAEIMKTRNFQVQLMKRRGGVGYDLSNLRPRGAFVNNAAKTSTGAASFMDVNSDICNEVAQNGRRGALMLSININHPDCEEFITKKQDLTKVTGANISVKVTDEFMQAVENDTDYLLRYPIDIDLSKFSKDYLDVEYDTLTYLEDHTKNNEVFYIKKVKARRLWNTLIHCAWNTAEPGIIFEGAMHNYSPDGVYDKFKMISTNPCGEIPMGAYDSCRLIHINLTSFVNDPFTDNAEIDDDKLYKISYEATRLADDLVDLEIEAVNKIIQSVKNDPDFTEFNLWSRIKKTAIEGRRAGLGFTGMADTIAMLGLKYDSDEGLYVVDRIMNTMFRGQLDSQIDMAIERGAFASWDASKEFNGTDGTNLWYKWLFKDHADLARKMCLYGRRNISWSTVAPTGTVSIMAQCSSGIEPVFLPFYERKRKCMFNTDRVDYTDIKGEKYTLFIVVHPKLKEWVEHQYNEDTSNWTLEQWQNVFKESPYYGSTAPEISWEQRVKLQGIIQKYITHSISSTINLPKEISEEEISNIYFKAWKTGNKGQTIYRDGCREGVLNKISEPVVIENRQAPKRPKELVADYYQVKVKGEQFIILVGLLNDKPYEIFAFRPLHPVNIPPHKGKLIKVRKMQYGFDSEHIRLSNLELANSNIEEKAATLYTSMLLRHGVDIEYIMKTIKKVNDNISSFSSAMCRILAKYVTSKEIKEVCPDCGGKLVRDGGCIHCLDCGYSKCL